MTSLSGRVAVRGREEQREPRTVLVGAHLHPAVVAAPLRAPFDPARGLVDAEPALPLLRVALVARLHRHLVALAARCGGHLRHVAREVVEIASAANTRSGAAATCCVCSCSIEFTPPSPSRTIAAPAPPSQASLHPRSRALVRGAGERSASERGLLAGRRIRTSTSGARRATWSANSAGRRAWSRAARGPSRSARSVPQWIGIATRGRSRAAARAASSGIHVARRRASAPSPPTGSSATSSAPRRARTCPSNSSVSPAK